MSGVAPTRPPLTNQARTDFLHRLASNLFECQAICLEIESPFLAARIGSIRDDVAKALDASRHCALPPPQRAQPALNES